MLETLQGTQLCSHPGLKLVRGLIHGTANPSIFGFAQLAMNIEDMRVTPMEDALRAIGSVEDWCEKYGAELDHETARSAQVARVIMLGCGGRLTVWGATDNVPREIHGTWWIAFTGECGLDLETYRCLSIHCESFREDVWRLDRKVRWAQHKLEVVEALMKALRFSRLLDAEIHQEQSEVA